MKKSLWILLALVFVSYGFGVNTDRTITGKVTSTEDGLAIPGVNILLKGTTRGTVSAADGTYSVKVPAAGGTLVFSFIGYVSKEIKIGKADVINVQLAADSKTLSELVVVGYGSKAKKDMTGSVSVIQGKVAGVQVSPSVAPAPHELQPEHWNTEEYSGITENTFNEATKNPLSTFSIDVDAAS